METRFGDYTLVERVGRGSMGDVYRARGERTGATVAIKVIAADLSGDEALRARFAREAMAATHLQHRHIVRVLESCLEHDPPFLVMEFLRGQSLAARLGSGTRPDVATSIDIVVQLLEGLQFAHEHGVVHRDVKPANIWLQEDGTVKLLDFGVARMGDSGLTRHGEMLGTLGYTAPEQVSGAPVDHRVDVFSVGAVLYELVTGRRPFEGNTPAATLHRLLGQFQPPMDAFGPPLPAALGEAVARALRRSPDERYDTAADFAVDLRIALLSLPAEALGPLILDADATGTRRVATPPPSQAPLDETLVVAHPHDGADGHTDLALRPFEPTQAAAPGARSAPAPSNAAPPGRAIAQPRPRGALFGLEPAYVAASVASVLVLLGLAWWLTRGEPTPVRPVTPPVVVDATTTATPARPAGAADVALVSSPAGAAVLVAGQDSGRRTPTSVSRADIERGAVVLRLPGHAPVTVRPDLLRPDTTRLALTLAPNDDQRRMVRVVARGTFPFEIVAGGRVISPRKTEHAVTVATGQVIRLRAGEYFLDNAVSLPAQATGTREVTVGGLGDLEVRSPRQNCMVTINGRETDYPTVSRRVVAGTYAIGLSRCEGPPARVRATVRAGGREIVRIG